MKNVESIKKLKKEADFFDQGYPVFFATHSQGRGAKKMGLIRRGVRKPTGMLILANNEVAWQFIKERNLSQITKEEHLNPKLKARKNISEKRINLKHGLGRFTDEELCGFSLSIKTSKGCSFIKNAYEQKQWMNNNKRHNNKNKTSSERMFWESFTETQKHSYLRTQYEIYVDGHTFFLDFYLPKLKVCVEIDGGYHYTQKQIAKDKERDILLAKNGIKVLRIKNENAHIEDPESFCWHPFVLSDERYELYFYNDSFGGAYCIKHKGIILSERAVSNFEKNGCGKYAVIKNGIDEIPENSIVIIKCQKNWDLFVNYRNNSKMIQFLSKKLYYLDVMYIIPSEQPIIDKLKDISKQVKQKNNHKNKCFCNIGAIMSLEEVKTNKTILKVYVNASLLSSKDGQIKATGIAYSLIDSEQNIKRSKACLDGHKYSCHHAIIIAILRLVKQHIPENVYMQIFTTDANCKCFDRKKRGKMQVGIELINSFDDVCKEKNITTEVFVVSKTSSSTIKQVSNIARKEAEKGLETKNFSIV